MSLNSPEISVVIPTYNSADFLKKCLESLISQTFDNWEALVINNFSTDNTVALVKGFCEKRIHLENFRNNGIIAASRNKGIELSRSNLIAFLDSDDIWYPQKLRRCLNEFSAETGMVCHGMRYIMNGRHWKDTNPVSRKRPDFFNLLYNGNRFNTSAVVVRKASLLKVGGFDENPDIVTAEDHDLWLKLLKENIRINLIGDILGEYHWHYGGFSRRLLLHLHAGLTVINKHSACRGFKSLHILKIRRAKALFLYGFARNFHRGGRRLMALQFFLKGLVVFPFSLKIYAGILLTLLPRSFSSIITGDLFPERAPMERREINGKE